MYKFYRLVTALIFIVVFTSTCLAQGQLFTKEEADKKFGPVLNSVNVPVSIIYSLSNATSNHLMFRVEGNQAIILDGNRNSLYPSGYQVNSDVVFTNFSVSMINQLISSNTSTFVAVEQRQSVLSLTFGQTTLEVGAQCPPICPD